jgi:cytosine/adenosine deaminase-related metal-dependent hydrolase
MNLITADCIFPGDGSVLENKILEYKTDGTIAALHDSNSIPEDLVERYRGALVPGFINTHCHLELSHMKGLVETGTSLLPFLKKVVQFRDFPQEVIEQAIRDGDWEMYNNGIVAVGDISNKADTALVKSDSPMDYYTFVEMFDFMQDALTESTIENYSSVFNKQSNQGNNKKSIVPHAPYTVSRALFSYINKNNEPSATVSIHNQETPEENAFFVSKAGGFIPFYESFGFTLDQFAATGSRSIHYTLENMNPEHKTIFVHNTTCIDLDIDAAHTWSKKVYWASCPNANLYIENRLPNYQLFLDKDARVTLGTDSLTSNWQLNIASEMLSIQKYASYVPLSRLTQWACLNGAEALGYEDRLGSFQTGKKPGINLIQVEKVKDEYRLKNDIVKKIV